MIDIGFVGFITLTMLVVATVASVLAVTNRISYQSFVLWFGGSWITLILTIIVVGLSGG